MTTSATISMTTPATTSVTTRPGVIVAAYALAGRSLRISRRQPDALITALMLPVMLMLIFVYFFGGAIDTGTAYVTYVVPGAMLLCAGFGAATTAVSVATDMKEGVIDRFRSLDIGGVPILAGHVAASVLRNLVSTGLVLAVALAIGLTPVIESLRALLLAQPAGDAPWVALAWCAAIGAVSVTLAAFVFERRTR